MYEKYGESQLKEVKLILRYEKHSFFRIITKMYLFFTLCVVIRATWGRIRSEVKHSTIVPFVLSNSSARDFSKVILYD